MHRCQGVRDDVSAESAQEAVEFALLFPIMVGLIMAIIEFSMLFNAWISVTAGAREGARLAAVRGSAAEVVARVQEATIGLDQGRLTVDADNTYGDGGDPGEQVVVTVTYNSPLLTPVIAAVFPGGVPLASQAVMRLE